MSTDNLYYISEEVHDENNLVYQKYSKLFLKQKDVLELFDNKKLFYYTNIVEKYKGKIELQENNIHTAIFKYNDNKVSIEYKLELITISSDDEGMLEKIIDYQTIREQYYAVVFEEFKNSISTDRKILKHKLSLDDARSEVEYLCRKEVNDFTNNITFNHSLPEKTMIDILKHTSGFLGPFNDIGSIEYDLDGDHIKHTYNVISYSYK